MTQPHQPSHTRPATLDDLEFLVHCNQQMALETEQLELPSERLQAGIHAVLTDSTRGFYRIAERDDQRAGCLMITYEWSDWRNAWWWWIQSVYVTPQQRRHGVFSTLYRNVIHEAQQRSDVCGLRLYVERDNQHAQATYARLRMHESHYRMFEQTLV